MSEDQIIAKRVWQLGFDWKGGPRTALRNFLSLPQGEGRGWG